MHLTTKESSNTIPLAIVDSKDRYNGEVIFIDPAFDSKDKRKPKSIADLNTAGILPDMPVRQRAAILRRLDTAIRTDTPPEADIRPLYESLLANSHLNEEFHLQGAGLLSVVPSPSKRECVYISAMSGAGKSYWCASYISEWKKLHPNLPWYLFSAIKTDEVLDKLEPIRVPVETFLGDDKPPLKVEDFEEGALILFDDCCAFPKPLETICLNIQNALLTTGRHNNNWVLITSHLMTDYSRTRLTLQECSTYVIFPHGANAKAISYLLETYVGIDKHQIKEIRKLPSRWIAVRRTFPPSCVWERGCMLLNKEDDQ